MNRIYFDYNATTPLSKEVYDFYVKELAEYANGSSLHQEGREVAAAIEKARQQIGALVNVKASELVFTSGGSESNNTVFNTMVELSKKRNNKVIVTSAIEHPCVLESSRRLESQFGFEVIYLPVDDAGIVDMESYKKALEKKPLLVSIMTANNEIGTIQDIKTLCSMAHEVGALFHTDAVQAVGKIPVDFKDWDIDYATLSAHKIYGPKGVGALYIKERTPIEPLIRGGHQEHGDRKSVV